MQLSQNTTIFMMAAQNEGRYVDDEKEERRTRKLTEKALEERLQNTLP